MPDETRQRALERNLSLYTAYLLGRETYFWMPVFFLFFSSRLGLDEVLLLEAVYYGSVVLLEVPSGYASDRLGRKRTLVTSGALLVASYLLFFFGDSAAAFAGAQVLLAGGLAFASGTDTSLLYENLVALDREDDYGDLEARLGKLGAWAMALGALTGGALGMFDLHYAYLASAVFAVLSLIAVALIEEPPHAVSEAPPERQLRSVWERARSPELAWLFAFAVLGIVMNHVPYEFYQGYLALSIEDVQPTSTNFAPLVAGLHATAVAVVAGFGAGASMRLSRRFGRRAFLMATSTAVLVLMTAMGTILHPVVALILVGRGLSGAMQKAPLREAIAPNVPSDLRATYLSVQSLAGRLGFAAMLAFLALAQPTGGGLDWGPLSAKIMWAGGACAIGLIVLWAWNFARPSR